MPARSAPRIGRTLASPEATPIETGTPAEAACVEGDDPLAERRADEPAVEVERCDEDLADRAGSLELAIDLVADQRSAPGRAADPEQRDVEPVPQVDDRADPRVRDERPLRGRVVDEPGRHQPARRGVDRVGDAAIRLALRCRSTSGRRTAARR